MTAAPNTSLLPVPQLEGLPNPQQVIDALELTGCVVIESLVDAATVEAVLAELAPYMEATPTGEDEISGSGTRRTGAVPSRSPSSWPMLRHPTLLAAAEHFLAPPGQRLHIGTAVTSDLLPGAPAQPIHRDQWTYGYYPWPTGFEVEFNVLWAMQEFTEFNGGTRIFPGSRAWDDGLDLESADATAVTCRAGSAIVVLGSCYHGAGANESDANRVALSIACQRAWLRQGENQYLNCPPDIARTMPDDLVRLLGYQRGSDALGYWRDGEDPMTSVHPERSYHLGLGMGPDATDQESERS